MDEVENSRLRKEKLNRLKLMLKEKTVEWFSDFMKTPNFF